MWDEEECHGGGGARGEIIEPPSSGDRTDDSSTAVLARAQSHGCGAVGVGLVAGRDDSSTSGHGGTPTNGDAVVVSRGWRGHEDLALWAALVDAGLANEENHFLVARFKKYQWTGLLAVTDKALPQRNARGVQARICMLRAKAATQHPTNANAHGSAGSPQSAKDDETEGQGPLCDGLTEADITHLQAIQDMVKANGGENNPGHQMCLEIEIMVGSCDHPLAKQVANILENSWTRPHHRTDKPDALFSITAPLATFLSHEQLLDSSHFMLDAGHRAFSSLDPSAVRYIYMM